LGGHGGEKVV
jgi:hypothetical protein